LILQKQAELQLLFKIKIRGVEYKDFGDALPKLLELVRSPLLDRDLDSENPALLIFFVFLVLAWQRTLLVSWNGSRVEGMISPS
jgi:hypothetical protein